jgi:hypothetical protein
MFMRHDLYVIQLNVSFRVLNNCKLNDRCVPSVNENTIKNNLEFLTFISTAMIGDKIYKGYWLCYF